MIVGMREGRERIGIMIMACCAVFVCNLFLNFDFDLRAVESLLTSPDQFALYNALRSTDKVVCGVSGGCLAATSAVLLVCYLKHYVDSHAKELGTLKALGHAKWRMAREFFLYGLDVLFGGAVGYAGSFALMPSFYAAQNEEGILPAIGIGFHAELMAYLVILPALAFGTLAVFYAAYKLGQPALRLIRGDRKEKGKGVRDSGKERSFLRDMRRSVLVGRKSLVFLMAFSAFCFSAMTQMSASMNDLASPLSGGMILAIGLLLAFTTLFLALATAVRSQAKNAAMMRAFGYSASDCAGAILGGYRPFAYLGFALGSVYQYVLLKIMVSVVFAGIADLPAYSFDWIALAISAAVFLPLYEAVLRFCSKRVAKTPIKEIMTE